MGIARNGKQELKYTPALADPMSKAYAGLASTTHEGIHRMIMQSDLRDMYHGMRVTGFQNTSTGHGVMNTFFIQVYLEQFSNNNIFIAKFNLIVYF